MNWQFVDGNGFDFLEDDETFCTLDNKKRKQNEECDKLELDKHSLKDNIHSAGYETVKILGDIK